MSYMIFEVKSAEAGKIQTMLQDDIVNRQSMTNTGQLPKFESDLFKLSGWEYY